MVELETKTSVEIYKYIKDKVARGSDAGITIRNQRWVSLESHEAAMKELENQKFVNGEDELLGSFKFGVESAQAAFKALLAEQRKKNPYPEDVFIEPQQVEWARLRKLMTGSGFCPDKYFGSMSRKVWNNCCEELLVLLEESLNGKKA